MIDRSRDRSILAEDSQSTVTSYCLFSQRSATMRLGMPAVSVVTIKPRIPNLEMKTMLKGKPMPNVIDRCYVQPRQKRRR
jgi:hypothetical protein